MTNNEGEIDWLNMSAAERIEPTKALFVAMRKVSITTGRHIDLLLDDALGEAQSRGTDYESNFRKGKIAAAKAMMIHQWLKQNYFEEAKDATKNIQTNLFQINPKSSWERFVKENALVGRLRIYRQCLDGIYRNAITNEEHGDTTSVLVADLIARAEDIQDAGAVIRLGQSFWFELDTIHNGYCVAFEVYQGEWHAFSVAGDKRRMRAAIQEGKQCLPLKSSGVPIDLVEYDNGGLHAYAFVVSPDSELPTDTREIVRWYQGKPDVEVHIMTARFV